MRFFQGQQFKEEITARETQRSAAAMMGFLADKGKLFDPYTRPNWVDISTADMSNLVLKEIRENCPD